MTEDTTAMTDTDSSDSTALPSMSAFTSRTETVILAGLVLLAAFAAIQLYFSLSGVINYWIAPKYEPLFRSGLNLAVLLLAATGISVMLRRRRKR